MKIWLLILAGVVLISCARATPYQPNTGLDGGYTDTHISTDVYRVEFQGNLDTSHETIKQYMYRRAKEVCVENGYNDYKIIDELPDIISNIAQATIQCIKWI